MVDLPDHGNHLVLGHHGIRHCIAWRQKGCKLFCLGQGLLVRIDFHKRQQIICRLKFCDRVFELHLVFGQIYVADAVNIRPGSADAQKLHLYNH